MTAHPPLPMNAESASPRQYVSDLINGFWAAPVIYAAVSLRIPDRLGQGAATAAALAEAAGAHAPSVFRLMRALRTLGLCSMRDDGAFELTPAGALLRGDVAGSVRGRALHTGDMLWKQYGDLAEVVRTGARTQAIVSGPEGFAQLEANPARLEAFQQAMAEGSVRAARGAIEAYDFGRFERVLDLGGGYGGVLSVLLTRHPSLTGAVCDLPYLARGAMAYLERAGVKERSAFVPGDFFEAVPRGYDAIVMKFVIHDWDDEPAGLILENCRQAATPSTRVILLEQVVPDRLGCERSDQAVIRADLTMLTVGGKERTAAEYAELCSRAGWRLTDVRPAGEGFSVLEAVHA